MSIESPATRNRTTRIEIQHSIQRELELGAKGVPCIGSEEFTLAGRTLAAKWLLSPSGKSRLRRGDWVTLRFWGDHATRADRESAIGAVYHVQKSGELPKDAEEELRDFSADPAELAADAGYLKEYAE